MAARHFLKCKPDHLLPWSVGHLPIWRALKVDVIGYVCEYVSVIPFSSHWILIFSKYLDRCKESIERSQKCSIINQASQTNEPFGPMVGWILRIVEMSNRGDTGGIWFLSGWVYLNSMFTLHYLSAKDTIALEGYSRSIMWEAPDCWYHPLIKGWEARLGSLGTSRWRPPSFGMLMMTDSPNMLVKSDFP